MTHIVNAKKPHLWWNQPWTIVESCTRCSDGCAQCWALGRLRKGLTEGVINLRHDRLDEPLHWRKPRTVFVLNDLFHEDVPEDFKILAFASMASPARHTHLVLTKRPKAARAWWNARSQVWRELTSHVWLGVTCESNDYLWRVEELVKTPAAVRWVNAHLLGPLDLGAIIGGPEDTPDGRLGYEHDYKCVKCGDFWEGEDHECAPGFGPSIDWLAIECNRPFRGDPAEWWGWCKALVEPAVVAGVPVWLKQGPTASGRVSHKLDEFPTWARRREMPLQEATP